jgi:prepilin-type N-terminal cleavage/methylation domain-containing protein
MGARNQKGFSLIELLIVVAIILIIAAIAIPNLMRSRIAANEASAVSSLRTITTAEHAYAQAYADIGYSCSLTELGPPASGQPVSSTGADILDPAVASGKKSGYSFGLSNCGANTPKSQYQSAAVPLTVGGSGQRSFCSDGSGIIQYSDDGVAASCISRKLVLQ